MSSRLLLNYPLHLLNSFVSDLSSAPVVYWCSVFESIVGDGLRGREKLLPTLDFSGANAGEDATSSPTFALLNWKELGGASPKLKLSPTIAVHCPKDRPTHDQPTSYDSCRVHC